MKTQQYEPRLYRNWANDRDLTSFTVTEKETDLLIHTKTVLKKEAEISVKKCRNDIEAYIKTHRIFLTTLKPANLHTSTCPQIISDMVKQSTLVGVGPMATVAGAIAEYVGVVLRKFSPEVIVENGGDIFLDIKKKRTIGLFSGRDSVFSQKIGLEILPEESPLGICTSSGTVGHSLSQGKADAVTVVSHSTLLADAAATFIGNQILNEQDIEKGIESAKNIKGLKGIMIVKNKRIGFWGNIKIVSTK